METQNGIQMLGLISFSNKFSPFPFHPIVYPLSKIQNAFISPQQITTRAREERALNIARGQFPCFEILIVSFHSSSFFFFFFEVKLITITFENVSPPLELLDYIRSFSHLSQKFQFFKKTRTNRVTKINLFVQFHYYNNVKSRSR